MPDGILCGLFEDPHPGILKYTKELNHCIRKNRTDSENQPVGFEIPLALFAERQKIIMKKSGILNADLLCELTKLRHLDKLVICDAGFPIPKGATVVDVSLVAGIPTFMQVLKAVLNEMIVEEYIIFDFMKEFNKEYYDEVKGIFKNQRANEIPMTPDFVEASKEAKLFIRTGELRPASNIMLVSASGVKEVCESLDICFSSVN